MSGGVIDPASGCLPCMSQVHSTRCTHVMSRMHPQALLPERWVGMVRWKLVGNVGGMMTGR